MSVNLSKNSQYRNQGKSWCGFQSVMWVLPITVVTTYQVCVFLLPANPREESNLHHRTTHRMNIFGTFCPDGESGKMLADDIIYLDYNATTPIDSHVAKAMEPYLTIGWGNPSSAHKYGKDAKEAVNLARRQVATMLRCPENEIIFTSGGSESNNYAIKVCCGYEGNLRLQGCSLW